MNSNYKFNSSLSQTPHIVAHLDFLGAKEKMRSIEERDAFLQQIYEIYIATANNKLSNITKYMLRSMYSRIFSDNILVALPAGMDNYITGNFLRIARFCTLFQFLALTKGLFVRGAITYGDFIGNDTFVFGEALVNAYEVETSRAIYPRILIDNSVFDNLHIEISNIIPKNDEFKKIIKRDFDGQWYISPFGTMPKGFMLENYENYLSDVKKHIFGAYQNSKYEKHKQKYYWLITKFNEFCEENSYNDQKIALAVNGEPMPVALDTIINNEVSHE